MQSGRHIGKIIIKMPSDPLLLDITSSAANPTLTLREDRTYLLVGGLGGLGRSVATWMVERGARHLMFMSRSADPGDLELARYVGELTSQGCEVQVVTGSVSEMGDVRRAVEMASKPIAGVINLSMVLRVSHVPPSFSIPRASRLKHVYIQASPFSMGVHILSSCIVLFYHSLANKLGRLAQPNEL